MIFLNEDVKRRFLHELEINGQNVDDDDDDYTDYDDDDAPNPPEDDLADVEEDDDTDYTTEDIPEDEERARPEDNVDIDTDPDDEDEDPVDDEDVAEDEDDPTEGEDEDYTDDADYTDEDYTDEDEPDAGDDADDSDAGDEEPDADYTDEGDDETDDTGDEGDPENLDDEDGGTDDEQGTSLADMEKVLFQDLTDGQMAIKNSELLQCYIDLYSSLNETFDNINKIEKTYTNSRAIDFIANKILELKEMVNYTITTTYINRTYVENLSIYKQCLLIYHQIGTMLKGLIQKLAK